MNNHDVQQDTYERGVLADVRQIMRNPDAGPLIQARLPFRNKTGSFYGTPIYGVRDFERDKIMSRVSYTARHGSGWITTGELGTETLEMFLGDLDDIASYRGNIYVVHSYTTLIGWTRGIEHAGVLYVPEIWYSNTTRSHQRIAQHPDR